MSSGDENAVVFEHAVIRLVPRVERAEFVNVGVVVYCQALDFLETAINVDRQKLHALDPAAELDEVEQAVESFVNSYRSPSDSPGERFRWLAAPRSTIVQTGPVHAGLTDDPAAELQRLMNRLVM